MVQEWTYLAYSALYGAGVDMLTEPRNWFVINSLQRMDDVDRGELLCLDLEGKRAIPRSEPLESIII